MSNKNLVARKLEDKGFETKVTADGVEISLNRFLWTEEVKTVLNQAFEMNFSVIRQNDNEVLVKVS